MGKTFRSWEVDQVWLLPLLLYAYSQGLYSSRRITKGCEERLDFAAVTWMQRPDFRTVSEFRKRHLAACRGCSCRC